MCFLCMLRRLFSLQLEKSRLCGRYDVVTCCFCHFGESVEMPEAKTKDHYKCGTWLRCFGFEEGGIRDVISILYSADVLEEEL